MSFLKALDGSLVRDQWPFDIGVPIKDHGDVDNLPRWRVMPAVSEEISEWLVVESLENDVDGVERPTVLYHPSVKDLKTKVIIHVQGFVSSVNIGPLGNWDGKEQSAGGAMQHLTLTSGGLDQVFNDQLESIEELRVAILSYLYHDIDQVLRTSDMSTLQLSRRVFHKIPLTPRVEMRNALRVGDDPRGKAAKIATRWRVPFRIAVGVQREDGKIVRTSQVGIRKGDFVDVSFSPEIITKRSCQGVRFEVKFDIQEVVRLYTRYEFSEELLALLAPDPTSMPTCVLHNADSGYGFEMEEEATAVH